MTPARYNVTTSGLLRYEPMASDTLTITCPIFFTPPLKPPMRQGPDALPLAFASGGLARGAGALRRGVLGAHGSCGRAS